MPIQFTFYGGPEHKATILFFLNLGAVLKSSTPENKPPTYGTENKSWNKNKSDEV